LLGLVRNGDRIRLSVKDRRIELKVDDAELKKRAAAAPPKEKIPERSYSKTAISSSLCRGEMGQKRNIKLLPQETLHQFYAERVIPIVATISVRNVFNAPSKSLEACLPLLIIGLYKCEIIQMHASSDGMNILSMQLTTNPSIELGTIATDVRALVEDRALPNKLAEPNPYGKRLFSSSIKQRRPQSATRLGS
jgi:hypothetical protein